MGLAQSHTSNYNFIERESSPESQINSIDHHQYRVVGPSRTPRVMHGTSPYIRQRSPSPDPTRFRFPSSSSTTSTLTTSLVVPRATTTHSQTDPHDDTSFIRGYSSHTIYGQTESPNRSLASPSPSCATPCLVIVNTQNAYFSTECSERQGESLSSRSDKRKTRDAGPGAAHSDKDLSTKGLRYSSDGKIEKPTGGVGKPGRGGYNLLRVALKWPEKRFNEVKKFIDETVEAKLDCLQPLGKQRYLKLEEVRTLAVAKFSFLEEYRGDWVVYDFIRCRLKYRKQALKRTASMKAAADSGSRQRISCYLNSDS
ncbi:hypothetical protein F5879DRAFT_924162 [Lentinula edodes]|nr:hypothetical protein F5879DRAFT_924162 [Lentinula edodes]